MELQSFFEKLFSLTAWEMTPPSSYSAFHLLLCAAGISAAIFSARRLAQAQPHGTARPQERGPAQAQSHGTARAQKRGPAQARKRQDRGADRILFPCGLVFLLMELYKQGFLYFVEFHGVYDWWYFPFQLCSIPMYLCLLYPLSGRLKPVLAAFVQDFGLLGGFMALLVPDGLMHPYWAMTLHGFLWHFLLIFVGFYCALSGTSDRSGRGFLRTLPLFFSCCLAAILVNTALGPASDADLFYLSPYRPSSQPVFHWLSLQIGIFPGMIAYMASAVAGAGMIHWVFLKRKNRRLQGRMCK